MYSNQSLSTRLKIFRLAIALSLLVVSAIPSLASAELKLDSPASLLARASINQNHLRDVINEIDQNLIEMRDQKTFDQYFFILDELQSLADHFQLDTIYPNAVNKLGQRMVQKGINWLHIYKDSQERILYYHRWIGAEPQVAFTFLYAVEIQLRDESSLTTLRLASTNLEALMQYGLKRWPNSPGLRILYESQLSEVAVKILKRPSLPEAEVLFWISKIYSAEAMTTFTMIIQSSIYSIEAQNKADLHYLLRRLISVSHQISKPNFNSPEALVSQVGDAVVDLILRSFRLAERLSNDELKSALETLERRHLIGLAYAWGQLKIDVATEFSLYFAQASFRFINELEKRGLKTEATNLSKQIAEKSSAIFAKHYRIEGLWKAVDSKKRAWFLNVIFASDDVLFVNFAKENGHSFPMFHVAYDSQNRGFVASLRSSDTDITANIPIRFFPQDDGTIKVIGMITADMDLEMTAERVQSYPQLLAPLDTRTKVDLNGVYEGMLTLPGNGPQKIRMVATVTDGRVIANLQHPSFSATLNYGNDGRGGIMSVTRGNDQAIGSWMHLRARLEEDGYLRGYFILGHLGLLPSKIEWKKVRSLNY